jgi:hypothetical protein
MDEEIAGTGGIEDGKRRQGKGDIFFHLSNA